MGEERQSGSPYHGCRAKGGAPATTGLEREPEATVFKGQVGRVGVEDWFRALHALSRLFRALAVVPSLSLWRRVHCGPSSILIISWAVQVHYGPLQCPGVAVPQEGLKQVLTGGNRCWRRVLILCVRRVLFGASPIFSGLSGIPVEAVCPAEKDRGCWCCWCWCCSCCHYYTGDQTGLDAV